MQRLAVTLGALLLLGSCAGDRAREADRPFLQGRARVERLEVSPLLPTRVQPRVVVHGTLPDACTELGREDLRRRGRRIHVTLSTRRESGAVCAQVVRPFSRTLLLPADLSPGFYTLEVNGVEAIFEVPGRPELPDDRRHPLD